jgi:alpha-D-xyloside xylohydrolase
VQAGGKWHRARHGFDSLPLFVRPGTVLPFGAQDDRPDYDHTEGVTFRLYELADETTATCLVPTLQGEPGVTCTVRRAGRTVDVRLSGRVPRSWRVQLAGIPTAAVPGGATVTPDELGVVVTPVAGSGELVLTLPASS